MEGYLDAGGDRPRTAKRATPMVAVRSGARGYCALLCNASRAVVWILCGHVVAGGFVGAVAAEGPYDLRRRLSACRVPFLGRLAPALGNTTGARCRTWRLTAAQFHAVREHLEHVADQCRAGKQRYSALRFNCFHLAFRCLDVAGFRWQRRTRQWVVFVPTIGSESFCKDLMPGATGTGREPDWPCSGL